MLTRVALACLPASPSPTLPFAHFVGFAGITTVSQSDSVFVPMRTVVRIGKMQGMGFHTVRVRWTSFVKIQILFVITY